MAALDLSAIDPDVVFEDSVLPDHAALEAALELAEPPEHHGTDERSRERRMVAPHRVHSIGVGRSDVDGVEGVIVGKALYAGAFTLTEALELTRGGDK